MEDPQTQSFWTEIIGTVEAAAVKRIFIVEAVDKLNTVIAVQLQVLDDSRLLRQRVGLDTETGKHSLDGFQNFPALFL